MPQEGNSWIDLEFGKCQVSNVWPMNEYNEFQSGLQAIKGTHRDDPNLEKNWA